MSRLPRWVWLALALAGAGVAAAFFWRTRALPVEVVEVRSAPLVRSVAVTGRVAPLAKVYLGSTLTARVRTVSVREGARVAAGAVLVQLDDAELVATVRQAEAALAGARARLASQRRMAAPMAEAQLVQARANAGAAGAERERAEDLFRQGFIGQSRLDEARRAAAVAASQLDAAQASAQSNARGPELEQALAREAEAAAAVELARSRLAQMRIGAPAAGVVLTRLAEPGQIVQPGTRLLEVSLDGPLQLVAQVDEKFLAQLAPGQRAAVLADAFPGQRFDARVASLAPGVDAQRGSVEVKFSLDAPPAFLRSDLTLSIEVETGRREAALVLPTRALRGEHVLVIEDGRASPRRVRTGLRTLTSVEVLEGLKVHDVVIVDSAVQAGQAVRAQAAAAARSATGSASSEAMSSAVQSMGR